MESAGEGNHNQRAGHPNDGDISGRDSNMSTVRSTAIPPAQLGAYLAQAPESATVRSTPVPALAALRQATAGQSMATAAAPLLASDFGEDGEAQRRATRDHLKRALANGKLMSLLVSAALRQTQAVEDYLPRASRWLAESARYLAAGLLRNAGLDPATAVLSGYHQYEIYRLLAALIEQNSNWVSQRMAETLAALLVPPVPADVRWPPEERRDWVSASAALDVEWGYARALARIAVAALEHDFNRARAVLVCAAAERADRLRQRLELDPSAYRIALLHYLNVGGRLYAGTLARVHRESVALIQDYQACLNRRDPAGADAIARQYQERRLGYDGIAFHFAATLRQFDGLTLERELVPDEAHLPPLASVSASNHPARSLPFALPSPPI